MIKQSVLDRLTPEGRGLAESLRQKESVDRGIARKVGVADNTVYVDYQPGNGTRYEVIFTRLDAGVEAAGIHQFAWLVTHMNGYRGMRSMVVQPSEGAFGQVDREGPLLVPSHVKEKLGCYSEADALVLAELICAFTGRTTVSTEKYLLNLYGVEDAAETALQGA